MTVTLDTAIFRYNTEDDLLCVIPDFQRQSPSGDRFYLTLSSVLYVLYGERVEKASRTGHAGCACTLRAPQRATMSRVLYGIAEHVAADLMNLRYML